MVEASQLMGAFVVVMDAFAGESRRPVAEVWIHVGSLSS